jgi:hypothetical protein
MEPLNWTQVPVVYEVSSNMKSIFSSSWLFFFRPLSNLSFSVVRDWLQSVVLVQNSKVLWCLCRAKVPGFFSVIVYESLGRTLALLFQ